jgi:putative hydrolase of the HAD superfamily
MLRCVLFDLGYTLVYARREEAFAALLRRVGVKAPQEEVAYALHRADQHFMHRHPGLLGQPEPAWLEPYVPVLLRELTGRPPDAALARDLTRLALAANRPPVDDLWRAYPDALPTLRRLAARGVVAGVVTNWDGTARRVLEATGLRPWVEPVVVSSECGREKPDPAIFRLALEQAGVEASEAVMVGDNGHDDVAGARAAGMRAFWLDRHLGRDLRRGDAPPSGATPVDSLAALYAALEPELGAGASAREVHGR